MEPSNEAPLRPCEQQHLRLSPEGRRPEARRPRILCRIRSGKHIRVWQHNFKTILWAPLLVTGGDLVFAGGTPDREFRAFDARTGDQLWSFPAPAGVIGIPTSFEVDGEQYIAVTAGW